MADDIRVHVLGEVEANRHTARIRIRIVVGNEREAGRVRKADGHRRRSPPYMRCASEGFRNARGRKRSGQHRAFGMGGPKAGMESEKGVELLQQIVSQRCELLVSGKGHQVPMYCAAWGVCDE